LVRVAAVACGAAFLGIAGAHAGKLDSGAEARSLVSVLEARPTDAPIAAEPVARAKGVLARVDEARGQQRENEARLLEDLALEWAQTAAHLLDAAALEAEAQSIDEELSDADLKLRRARALLEETEMRRGRARTELLRLEPESVDELDPPDRGATP
jgi:hypothetical protein